MKFLLKSLRLKSVDVMGAGKTNTGVSYASLHCSAVPGVSMDPISVKSEDFFHTHRIKPMVVLSAIFLAARFLGANCVSAAQTAGVEQKPLTIVLDSGHNPSQPGALGARGIYEVVYNDNLTAQIADALKKAGFSVILTRTPAQEISLDGRAQIANANHADLFLAIHHDSAQPKYVEETTWHNLSAERSKVPLSGYSIYISRLNPCFDQSSRFAEFLGQEMLKLGRPPALYHAEKIPGENRELLNAKLGIYRYDDLIVLKRTTVPAVLIEAGVIIDRNDEKYVSNKHKQKAIVQAIVAAVQEYDRFRSEKR
jgi:N-acetylmuramoyl-L-alanine amidase